MEIIKSGEPRETAEKLYNSLDNRVTGHFPPQGILSFDSVGGSHMLYIAYLSVAADTQIDGKNKFETLAFTEEELNNNTPEEFASVNSESFKVGLRGNNIGTHREPLDSEDWKKLMAREIADEIQYINMNYRGFGQLAPSISPKGSKVADFEEFGGFGEKIFGYLSTAADIRNVDVNAEGFEPQYKELVVACKKEKQISTYNKIMNKLIKDFDIGKPLNIKVIRYKDGDYGSVAFFFDGFTVIFGVGNYSSSPSFKFQKNTPYAIKNQELNVGLEFRSGWSPRYPGLESYDRYYKPFFAKWLDTLRGTWKISLDDEEIEDTLEENPKIDDAPVIKGAPSVEESRKRNKEPLQEEKSIKFVVYEEGPDFDGFLDEYGELRDDPEDAQTFDTLEEASDEIPAMVDLIEDYIAEGEDGDDFKIQIFEYDEFNNELSEEPKVDLDSYGKILTYIK